jgi:hypothetical protein
MDNYRRKYNIFLFYAFQWITDLSVKTIFDNFTEKLSKNNLSLLNDETTFFSFSPCGTLILFLLKMLTLAGLFRETHS